MDFQRGLGEGDLCAMDLWFILDVLSGVLTTYSHALS
jgi:hypothetical protein